MQRLWAQEKVLQLSESVPPPPGDLCYLASHKKLIPRFHMGLYERWYLQGVSRCLPAISHSMDTVLANGWPELRGGLSRSGDW